jgi:multimeric flavodoxin WrbA
VTLVDVSHKKIAGCMACEYCHGKGNGACIQKDDMQELYPLLAEAEVLVLASPVYYFTLSAQIQAPIQRFYCMMRPANVKKTALLLSSHSPGVYDAAITEYKFITGFCGYEDTGIVTAKLDEQKTDETKQKVISLVKAL